MKRSIGIKGLIYYCKAGVALEYGKNSCDKAYKNILNDVFAILNGLGMTESKIDKIYRKTDFYKIKNVVKKHSNYSINKNIKNFKLIKKGQVIAKNKKEKIIADNGFYPVLFGEESYKDIFGFVAEKVDKIK